MNLLAIVCIIVVTACSFVLMIAAVNIFSNDLSVINERQQQAQLDAQADEMQRLRFRLRRIEDKLGIKEGDEER